MSETKVSHIVQVGGVAFKTFMPNLIPSGKNPGIRSVLVDEDNYDYLRPIIDMAYSGSDRSRVINQTMTLISKDLGEELSNQVIETILGGKRLALIAEVEFVEPTTAGVLLLSQFLGANWRQSRSLSQVFELRCVDTGDGITGKLIDMWVGYLGSEDQVLMLNISDMIYGIELDGYRHT